MSRFRHGIAIAVVATLLAGCATTKYCERSAREYEQAVESAPLKAPDGVVAPKPDSNLAIPPATGPQVPFATVTADSADTKAKSAKWWQWSKKKSGQHSACLDQPPPIPPEQTTPAKAQPGAPS